MKRVTSCFLLMLAAVVLSAGSAWSHQICPLGGGIAGGYPWGGSVQIRGTHYDVLGNATKISCDTTAGDFMIVGTEGASPPTLSLQLHAVNPPCEVLEGMVQGFPGFGPRGTEVQVVKNGTPKRECIFHAAAEHFDSAFASYWAVHTVRKFNSAGTEPTTEKGSFTVNSPDGQIFIGKIMIRYP